MGPATAEVSHTTLEVVPQPHRYIETLMSAIALNFAQIQPGRAQLKVRTIGRGVLPGLSGPQELVVGSIDAEAKKYRTLLWKQAKRGNIHRFGLTTTIVCSLIH